MAFNVEPAATGTCEYDGAGTGNPVLGIVVFKVGKDGCTYVDVVVGSTVDVATSVVGSTVVVGTSVSLDGVGVRVGSGVGSGIGVGVGSGVS